MELDKETQRGVRDPSRGWAEYGFLNVHVVKAHKNGRKHQKRKYQGKARLDFQGA